MKDLLHLYAAMFDCTIIEEHMPMYYSSLEQSFDETFFTVMRSKERLFQINANILENWVTPAHLLSMFKGC